MYISMRCVSIQQCIKFSICNISYIGCAPPFWTSWVCLLYCVVHWVEYTLHEITPAFVILYLLILTSTVSPTWNNLSPGHCDNGSPRWKVNIPKHYCSVFIFSNCISHIRLRTQGVIHQRFGSQLQNMIKYWAQSDLRFCENEGSKRYQINEKGANRIENQCLKTVK